MNKLTQLQYEVIFLYSKGFTFKEIDNLLVTSSKGVYMQVMSKDKGRVTRAKKSREINLNRYKQDSSKYIFEIKLHNKEYKNNIISLDIAKENFRNNYLNDCMIKSLKSYNKYKLTFLKNHLQNVA
ncbi:hypothetical protein [Arcobacter sp. 15-2]|uniref:hypothetical protein n=1 Tax=Arcobacter sp. 15-2 TaxID=3374109 RepID=UPI00399CE642